MVAELLPCVYVGDGHLGERQRHSGERVAEHHRGVGESPGVELDGRAVVPRGVDRVDQHPFVIALHCTHLEAELGRRRTGDPFHVCERRGAEHLGLAGAEEIQVRPVDEEDPPAHSPTSW